MRCNISLHSSHDCGSFFPDGSCSRVIFTSPPHTLLGICVHCSGEITSWTPHYENAILGIHFLPFFTFFLAILAMTSTIDINICQPEAHWFLKHKILLFHSLPIWITKTTWQPSLYTPPSCPSRRQADTSLGGAGGFKPPAFFTLHSWLPPPFLTCLL